MRTLSVSFLLLLSGTLLSAATFNCTNNTASDAAGVQNVINAGGTGTLTGTCALGNNTINVSKAVVLQGGATITSTANNARWFLNSDNITLQNLTFDHVYIAMNAGCAWCVRNNVNILNSTIRNYTGTPPSADPCALNVTGIWKNSHVDGNTWSNFIPGGWNPNLTAAQFHALPDMLGICESGGVDTWTFNNNSVAQTTHDFMHLVSGALNSASHGYAAKGVQLNFNKLVEIGRMGFEIQGQTNNCQGVQPGDTCTGNPTYDGLAVDGNYFHAIAFGGEPFGNTYFLSAAFNGINSSFRNNTALFDFNETGLTTAPYGMGGGYAIEGQPGFGNGSRPSYSGMYGGNVIAAMPPPGFPSNRGWVQDIAIYDDPIQSNLEIAQQNVFCGPGGSTFNGTSSKPHWTFQFNYANATCPFGNTNAAQMTATNITPTFLSPPTNFPSGGNGTFNLGVVSNLSVKWVNFYIDSSSSPIVHQEWQDDAPSFPSNRQWLYHATINTSLLTSGAHTLKATATDANDGTQSVTTSFTVTGGTSNPNNCTNNVSTDPSLVQTAINAGGAVTLMGTCNLGSNTININAATTLTGGATFTGNSGYNFQIHSDNVSISGMTFSGAGIQDQTNWNTRRNSLSIQSNTFNNFTNQTTGSAISVSGILTNSSIASNTFTNFCSGGFSAHSGSQPGSTQLSGPVISILNGLDNTQVIKNTIDQICGDGIFITMAGMSPSTGTKYTGSTVIIDNNVITNFHRRAIAIQPDNGTNCNATTCDTTWKTQNGMHTNGNQITKPMWPYSGTNGITDLSCQGGCADFVANNTVVANDSSLGATTAAPNFGIETPAANSMNLIGNVVGSALSNGAGWSPGIQNYVCASCTPSTIIYQNNLLCGPPNASHIATALVHTNQANVDSTAACPSTTGAVTTSITPTWQGAPQTFSAVATTGTFTVGIQSALALRAVAFSVDNVVLSTQVYADVSNTFATDLSWIYHATINPSTYSQGTHVITALTVDTSGTTASVSQNFVVGTPASNSFTCTNNAATDANGINAAIGVGGIVTISGTCNLGTATPAVTIAKANVDLEGPSTWVSDPTVTDSAVSLSAAGVTIHNITFTNSALHVTGTGTATLDGLKLLGNTWQNFNTATGTNGYGAVVLIDPIITNAQVTGNTFSNIWTNSFPSTSVSGDTSIVDGIFFGGGLGTGSIVESNTFNQISGNALRFFVGGSCCFGTPTSTAIQNATGVSVSYNKFTYVHRRGIYMQGGNSNTWSAPKIAGNLFYHPAVAYGNTNPFNLGIPGNNMSILNNAAILDVTGNTTTASAAAGNAFEFPPGADWGQTPAPFNGGGIIRGNVVSGDSTGKTPPGWTNSWLAYRAAAATTFDNNVMCGPANNSTFTASTNFTESNNYKTTTCPAGSGTALWTSSISGAWTSANNQSFSSGGPGTWSYTVTANSLPVKKVDFLVDGGSTPTVTQEVQDLNTNFGSDRLWKYHATFDTTPLTAGSHTIVARVTDISGATSNSTTQNFTTGATGVGIVTLSTNFLMFSGQALGVTSSSNSFTIQNTGTGTLTISSIAVSPMVLGQFAMTTTCGGTLAANASCTVNVTHTPTGLGVATGAVIIKTTLPTSPNFVLLMGTGLQPCQ